MSVAEGTTPALQAGWLGLAAELVAADPGPQVTIATARRWAAESAADAYECAWDAGRLDLTAEEKRAQMGIVRALHVDLNPWHVCCRSCRRGRHKDRCGQCEDRTREAFGLPHPDDYPGQEAA